MLQIIGIASLHLLLAFFVQYWLNSLALNFVSRQRRKWRKRLTF